MSHDNPHFEPAKYPKLISFLGAVGSLFLFLIILAITYISSDKEPVEGNIAAMREATLEENSALDARKANELKLVDAVGKIYKIPVSDAMDLTAAKLQKEDS